MVTLTPIELLNGTFALIIVFFSTLVGLLIISRYFQLKQKSFLFIGLTWIGLVEIWWGISISTIYVLATGSTLPDPVYMFIGNFFLPFTTVIAILGFSELTFKEKQKQVLIPYLIYGIIFEIVFIYFLLTDYTMLGKVNSPVDATYWIFVTIYQIVALLTFVVVGNFFCRTSLRSDNPEIKLKGKLLLLGINLFLFGAILEILSDISLIIMISGRILLIISSFMFYGGFLLPNWLKKLLKK